MKCKFIAIFIVLFKSIFAQELDHLPIPTGSYQVGFVKYDLYDPHRKDLENPAGRLIPIQIYFPTAEGTHQLSPKVFEERAYLSNWNCNVLKTLVYSHQTELTALADGAHPVIFLNHGNSVSMTDYAYIAEDLASHGYVVVAIQHQLISDAEEPKFWDERSCSRYGKIIDNILFIFEWLKETQESHFHQKINLNRIGFIGHSQGGNALLLLANRASQAFKKKQFNSLLPRENSSDTTECLIILDTGGFPYPQHNQFPIFFLMSEKKEEYQKKCGDFAKMVKIGHEVRYYKGAKHISFMDHGYINPENPLDPTMQYFNGSIDERIAFFDTVRKDIREFLEEKGVKN